MEFLDGSWKKEVSSWDAEKFLSLGADRLGTSSIIKIVKNEKATGY